jgi:MFS family permease
MSREKLLTRPFVLCSLANLVQSIAFDLFLHFPGFLHGLGTGDVEIGVLFGLTGVSAILARPPIGRSMDTRGRCHVILLGNAVNICALSLYLTVESVGPGLYAIRILHGIAEAMLFTAFFTYAADCVPSARRTEGLALFGVSGMLPIALGGVLGDVILKRWDFDVLFMTSCGLAVLAFLLSLPLRDLPRGGGEEEPSRGFWAALTQRDLLPLWLVTCAFTLALASIFTFVKRFVDETGLATVGTFFSAYAGVAIVVRMFLGWMPDRVGPKRVLFPALGAMVAGFFLLATAGSAFQVLAAGTLFGIGHGYAFPVLFGIVITRARWADRGSAMGIFTALFDVGAVVGGPLTGALITLAGFGAGFGAAGAIIAVGGIAFFLWDGRR